jgi:hypothetical protein
MNATFTIYNEQDPASQKQFADEFEQTEVGQRFFNMQNRDSVEDAWSFAISKFRKVHGDDPIVLGDFVQFMDDLMLSGAIQAPAPWGPKEKQLSRSQLQWKEFREFSETHSMNECRARAASDQSFSNFMHKNMEREMAENQGPELSVNLNIKGPATTQFISDQLRTFVETYRTTPTDKLRLLSNPGSNPEGPTGARKWNALFSEACEKGLI